MSRFPTVSSDDEGLLTDIWQRAHAPGVPATGLGEALLLEASHLQAARRQTDRTARLDAVAAAARLDTLAVALYGHDVTSVIEPEVTEHAARGGDGRPEGSRAEVARSERARGETGPEGVWRRVRRMGEADAAASRLRIEPLAGHPIVVALRSSARSSATEAGRRTGSPDYQASRWGFLTRGYWDGAARELVRSELLQQGRLDAVDQQTAQDGLRQGDEVEGWAATQQAAAARALAGGDLWQALPAIRTAQVATDLAANASRQAVLSALGLSQGAATPAVAGPGTAEPKLRHGGPRA